MQSQQQPDVLAAMFRGDTDLVRQHFMIAKECTNKRMPVVKPMFKLEQERAAHRTSNDVMFFILVHCHSNPSYNELLGNSYKTPALRAKFTRFCRILARAFMCLVSGLNREGGYVQRTSEKW